MPAFRKQENRPLVCYVPLFAILPGAFAVFAFEDLEGDSIFSTGREDNREGKNLRDFRRGSDFTF
ncbi:MAG: hypothetical protein HPY58_09950 [Firmicutes bacterium]|nr:hypothetical protein [Bacillota bacterium]